MTELTVIPIIVARNEEECIGDTIKSIKDQTYLLEEIIVVDDGSYDSTADIARKLRCRVITLPPHEESYVGRPELSIRWNIGLNYAKRFNPDFILIMGADHILPKNYVEELLDRMTNRIVIAAGRFKGQENTRTMPHGSGRLVKADFWEEALNLSFPVSQGWESWLLYKALQMGYDVVSFPDLVSKARPTSLTPQKAWGHGRGMWCLGYYWMYAVARSVTTSLRSPISGLYMFIGWFTHRGCERLDVASYVNCLQRGMLWRRAKDYVRGLI